MGVWHGFFEYMFCYVNIVLSLQ
eukprot:COSAG02_NODE_36601_length_452_cov_5.450425_1_plen_22_part_01